MLKPPKKPEFKFKYETFATPELIEDALHNIWNAMRSIDDDDEIEILDLPAIIRVIIKSKKRREGVAVYRKSNGNKKL